VVDRDQVPAGLECGEVHLDHLGAVGQQRGHDVTGLEVEAPQGKLVAQMMPPIKADQVIKPVYRWIDPLASD